MVRYIIGFALLYGVIVILFIDDSIIDEHSGWLDGNSGISFIILLFELSILLFFSAFFIFALLTHFFLVVRGCGLLLFSL